MDSKKHRQIDSDRILNIADHIGVTDLVKLGIAHLGAQLEKTNLVEVPELYDEDYRVKLDEAKRWLEEDGLRVESVVVQPRAEYRDYTDMEVISTNYSMKDKVKPGTRIIVKYITTEVIEESQRLYDESEQIKLEEEQQLADKKAAKVEKRQQNRENTVSALKKSASNAVIGTKNAFKKPTSKKDESTEDLGENEQ